MSKHLLIEPCGSLRVANAAACLTAKELRDLAEVASAIADKLDDSGKIQHGDDRG